MIQRLSKRPIAIGAALLFSGFALASASAQRGTDWDWDGNYQRLARINAGTFLTVRTTQTIASDRTDGRSFAGVVAEDVWDDEETAREFLGSPQPQLAGRSPIDMAATELGARQVEELLMKLEYGLPA